MAFFKLFSDRFPGRRHDPETSYLRGRRSLTRNRVERRAPEYEKLCLDLRRHGRALGHLESLASVEYPGVGA